MATSNYQLNQYELTDRIQMENFNNDNSKIDKALKTNADAVASAQATMSKLGNCNIEYGTYKGTNTFGASNPNRLTFKGKPLLVIVENQAQDASWDYHLRMMHGCNWAVADRGNSNYNNVVSWGSNYVQWYNTVTQACQFNHGNYTYSYVAFLAADA